MQIDINRPIGDVIRQNPKLKEILLDIGFKGLDNPLMLKTMGSKISIKRGAKMMGIEELESKLKSFGIDIIDSVDLQVIERKKLIKSYISRLSQGEDLESVRADFMDKFEGVSSSEIMDAEEELLASGIDKKELRRLCDIHSSLFHGITEAENNKLSYDDIPLLSYLSKENEKIKDLLISCDSLDDISDFKDKLNLISKHYRKKGDLIYPILKEKYNKPGPSDVMWAVDIEIVNSLKKAIKLDKKDLFDESIKRAVEMTYKEDNILYPLIKDTLSSDDLELLYEDLAQYDHDLVEYKPNNKVNINSKKEDKYIYFNKGKMTVDELSSMLDTLDLEITFVDKNDINAYYNDHDGKKVFKRPVSSLGRELYYCHPPQVEPIVRGLIADFKSGKKDIFRLVKNIAGTDYAITYFAVRDKDGKYQGVLETVQDLGFYTEYINRNIG